jgi:hypothetical protein
VNDSMDAEIGEAVLFAFAERIREQMRPQDTVARFGEDEFAVLLEEFERPRRRDPRGREDLAGTDRGVPRDRRSPPVPRGQHRRRPGREVPGRAPRGLAKGRPGVARHHPIPLLVCDAGHDPMRLQQGLEGCPRGSRLACGGRYSYTDPVGPPARTGRPRRHGCKMDTKDPSTWPEPNAEHACEDAGYGTVRVRAWAGLHPRVQVHADRGSRGPRPIVRRTLVLVEVERPPRDERRREPRVL